jgi:Protein of unknown function (DUF3054)
MNRWLLVLGDILALLLTTLLGFVSHRETDLSFVWRFFAVFLPLTLAWFLLAPWFGLFEAEITSNPRQFWRVVLAMVFAAPWAVVIRGLILNAAILPIFVIVLGATSALGVAIWRGLYFLLKRNS